MLNSQTKLFHVNTFNFKLIHLLVIGILILSFSTSFFLRSQQANHGFELNEFDPFFNFRATEYIVENGFSEYFEWNDDKSWYPRGRDVSATSQVMLHSTAAISYQIFGGNSSLYDFTILFPAVIGSLTVIIIFALVRLFAGTAAGLIASLLFAVSLPIVIRGSIGWFKSEPLGIFYGLLGLYLFLSAINSKNKKITISKIIFGGMTLGFGMSSWGGDQFFIIPIGLFILALPFVRKDHKFLLWGVPLFVITFILISSLFERPGPNFVYYLGGLSLLIPTIFLISSIFIQKISKSENKIRNCLFLLISIIIIGSFLLIINEESNVLPLPSFRYLNAMNPFLTTIDPLVDSVAEHATPTMAQSFLFHSILMIFSGLGIWFILSKKSFQSKIIIKNDMKIFVLIIGITGIYVSSAFIRLEVFASISLIILASIGLSVLSKEIFKINFSSKRSYILKISYIVLIFTLFIIPLVFPANANWISGVDIPPTILTGATNHPPSNDWLEALEWIKLNTPENSVIASWWDYGYWIQTLAERASLADNSTTNSHIIQNIANMLLSTPDDSWNMLQKMDADYVLIFLSAQKVNDDSEFYVLGKGGDESKIIWFARIAELPTEKYLRSDGFTGTNYFNEQTMLGKMIPFTTAVYYNTATQEYSEIYKHGFVEIVQKNIEYNSDNDPLKLVYTSPGFMNEKQGYVQIILVYEVNKNYIP